MSLENAVALATGASRGIGAACAALSARCTRLIVCGRDTDRLRAPAASLGATPLAADLTAPGATGPLVRASGPPAFRAQIRRFA